MPTPDDRVAELIAAAVAGELSPAESAELDDLRRRFRWIDAEIAELSDLGGRLHATDLDWLPATDDSALRDRILTQTTGAPATPAAIDVSAPAPHRVTGAERPRRWLTPTLAAACLVIGFALGIGVPAVLSAPPTGPPGTLGVVERVDVQERGTGTRVEADLVAHTWGTEAVLDATGLEVGATYSVVFISAGGTEFPAGEMLGSTVPIHCSLNAALLRADAVRLEVRDADSETVATADLPRV